MATQGYSLVAMSVYCPAASSKTSQHSWFFKWVTWPQSNWSFVSLLETRLHAKKQETRSKAGCSTDLWEHQQGRNTVLKMKYIQLSVSTWGLYIEMTTIPELFKSKLIDSIFISKSMFHFTPNGDSEPTQWKMCQYPNTITSTVGIQDVITISIMSLNLELWVRHITQLLFGEICTENIRYFSFLKEITTSPLLLLFRWSSKFMNFLMSLDTSPVPKGPASVIARWLIDWW